MAINGAIIIQTGFWGLIPILMKEVMLNEGNQKRKYIRVLKKSNKIQKKNLLTCGKISSQDEIFLKGLALTASITKFFYKKNYKFKSVKIINFFKRLKNIIPNFCKRCLFVVFYYI